MKKLSMRFGIALILVLFLYTVLCIPQTTFAQEQERGITFRATHTGLVVPIASSNVIFSLTLTNTGKRSEDINFMVDSAPKGWGYQFRSIYPENTIASVYLPHKEENEDKAKKTSDLTPFTDAAITKIAEYSMGLPGLALDLADKCLLGIDDFNAKELTPELVDPVAEVLQYPLAKNIEMGHAISYIEVENGEQKRKELNLNSGSKTSILKEILFQSRIYPERPGITNKKLTNSRRISIQAHTISYHTNILERCKILEVQEGQQEKKKGKYRYFQIKKPIMNAIELKILSQKPPTSPEVVIER